MELRFTPSALSDYRYWKRNDPRKLQRIEKLCEDTLKHPFDGIGKPEPLRFDFQGCWSKRIDRIHRLVYRVEDDVVIILSCRYHY